MDSLSGPVRVRAVLEDAWTILCAAWSRVAPRQRPVLAVLAALALASLPAARAGDTWEKIDPADLAMREAPGGTGADSEYLFYRVSLEDDADGVSFRYQVRAKIYTARGVENAGLLHIDRPGSSSISRLAARVVKPDGTSFELKKSDFLETKLVKQGNDRWLRTSFAFPGLAPGDIVEYRWRVDTEGGSPAGYYFCQQSVPTREYEMEISARFADLSISWFNVPKLEQTKKGDSRLILKIPAQPAFTDEPHASPELDHRGWIRLAYAGGEKDPVKAWDAFTKAAEEFFDRNAKPNDAIRKKATELIAGAANDDEKIRRLYDFCHEKIINVHWSDAPEARAERERKTGRDFQSARETLAKGRGWAAEIDYLFAALLQAAGFDPHRAMNAPRWKILNTRIVQGWGFMGEMHVALKRGGQWVFYSPGDYLVPFGMNDRFDEGAAVFVIDGKQSAFGTIPLSSDGLSQLTRKGRFTLDADGTLRGTVETTFTGHEAMAQRAVSRDTSDSERAKDLADALRKRIAGAEATEIKWEHLGDRDGPVILRYQVEIPGYAESAGQRLVMSPGYFTRGRDPAFTAPERTAKLMWSNTWQEHDDIEIVLPPGFALEQATAPQPVVEESGQFGAKYTVGYSKRRHTLVYKRDFNFGPGHGLVFPPAAYPVFKALFERLHESDTHSVVLRPAEAETSTTPAASTPAAPAPAAATSGS